MVLGRATVRKAIHLDPPKLPVISRWRRAIDCTPANVVTTTAKNADRKTTITFDSDPIPATGMITGVSATFGGAFGGASNGPAGAPRTAITTPRPAAMRLAHARTRPR